MRKIIALFTLIAAFGASAQSRIISIDAFDLSYTGGLSFMHHNSPGPDRDETNFRFNLNYAQNLPEYVGLMWKAKAYINRTDVNWGNNDSLETAYGVAGGFLYNIDAENIKNSIFAGLMLGLERATYEFNDMNDKSGFNVSALAEAGKRWDLGQYSVANISYAPSVSLELKRYGGSIRKDYFKNSQELRLNFLKFDILF